MDELPTNVHTIILGTGVAESVLSTALSILGKQVLHLDRFEHYGGYTASLRFSELQKRISEWNCLEAEQAAPQVASEVGGEGVTTLSLTVADVAHAEEEWSVGDNEESTTVGENMATNDTGLLTYQWTRQAVQHRVRRLELELHPKIVYSDSETVKAIIKSDVTRYLEFRFLSRFLTVTPNGEILHIPVSRADVFRTKLLGLRQKRMLCSFLEWCYSVQPDDTDLQGYAGTPMVQLMTEKRGLDTFTQTMITTSLTLSKTTVETVEGVTRLKRLLHSMNKFGPYPVLWPIYGCGEIPQAFCRMSAVFGGTFCLQRTAASITTIDVQLSSAEDEPIPNSPSGRLLVTLDSGHRVHCDHVILHASYAAPGWIDSSRLRWIARAILFTDRTLLDEERQRTDISMLAFPLADCEDPVVILEFPVDDQPDVPDLFVVHMVVSIETSAPARQVFRPVIDALFTLHTEEIPADVQEAATSTPAASTHVPQRPRLLYAAYFTLPDYSSAVASPIRTGVHIVGGPDARPDMDAAFVEAETIFRRICPDTEEEFLPRPPNPEDVIHYDPVSAPNNMGEGPDLTNGVEGGIEAALELDTVNNQSDPMSGDHAQTQSNPLTIVAPVAQQQESNGVDFNLMLDPSESHE